VPDLSHRQLALYLVAGALVVLIGAKWVMAGGHAAQGAAPPANTFDAWSSARAAGSGGGASVAGADGQAVVDVTGEVRRPGVYRMAAGARVEAAVTRAGGATAHAELGAVNLAAKVQDGQQVVVPRRGPGGAAVAAAGAASATGAAAGGAPAAPVNLFLTFTSNKVAAATSLHSPASGAGQCRLVVGGA